MKYVIDNNSLSQIFKTLYFESFPTFWSGFNSFVEAGELLSTREVFNEIQRHNQVFQEVNNWIESSSFHRSQFFTIPTVAELNVVREIFSINQFMPSISKKNYLRGYPSADPFIIAKAKVIEGTVITEERYCENAAKIPNICKKLGIRCITLRTYFVEKKWIF